LLFVLLLLLVVVGCGEKRFLMTMMLTMIFDVISMM
jgi:hypothetical protein